MESMNLGGLGVRKTAEVLRDEQWRYERTDEGWAVLDGDGCAVAIVPDPAHELEGVARLIAKAPPKLGLPRILASSGPGECTGCGAPSDSIEEERDICPDCVALYEVQNRQMAVEDVEEAVEKLREAIESLKPMVEAEAEEAQREQEARLTKLGILPYEADEDARTLEKEARAS
jgi:hypothetical protein